MAMKTAMFNTTGAAMVAALLVLCDLSIMMVLGLGDDVPWGERDPVSVEESEEPGGLLRDKDDDDEIELDDALGAGR